jgi:hypothetical protein
MKSNLGKMQKLARSKPKQRVEMLKGIDDTLVKSICECCYNVVRGNIPIKSRQLKNLHKYRKEIRDMADRHVPLRKKRRIIQKGGFLGPLFSLIAPLIGGLVSTFAK